MTGKKKDFSWSWKKGASMLELREKKLDYAEPKVSVVILRLYGVSYFDLFVGDEMFVTEKEVNFYA